MEIMTTRFGKLTIQEKDVLKVAGGVLGLPDFKQYVILEHDAQEDSPFKWLQSVENPDLAFVVIDPRLLVPDFKFTIDSEFKDQFESDRLEDYIPMVIVKIPQDEPQLMTANLRGPILIHTESRKGGQVVLTNEDYAFDHLIFQNQERATA